MISTNPRFPVLLNLFHRNNLNVRGQHCDLEQLDLWSRRVRSLSLIFPEWCWGNFWFLYISLVKRWERHTALDLLCYHMSLRGCMNNAKSWSSFYPGHFSGLFMQLIIVRWGFPSASYKSNGFPKLSVPQCNTNPPHAEHLAEPHSVSLGGL